MRDIRFTIIRNKKLADKTYEMVLGCEEGDHGISRPGQFINIRLEGLYLRRPISVCDWTDKTVTIIYKTVGKGTERMSSMAAGEKLDILTPLGNGYDTAKTGDRPVLIGGGAGVPPMFGLCKALLSEGKSPAAVLGFNTAEEVFYKEKFEELGVNTVVATADGSLGVKGFVTDAIQAMEIATQGNQPSYTSFCACGPEAMLKALDHTIDANVPGQLSFEERMGCGFGACMGCSCETKYGYKRICKEGPVLDRDEVKWNKAGPNRKK